MKRLLSVAAILVLLSLPASAHHKEGHDGGGHSTSCDGGSLNQHPSGKDRECESGGSGTQGGSDSEPDQDGKGPERDSNGTDKPGGPGGEDSDRDGNNGCGNDDDFNDDNEGRCGGPAPVPQPSPPDTPTESPVPTLSPSPTVGEAPPSVLGERLSKGDGPEEAVADDTLPASEGRYLPETGADLVGVVTTGLALIALGVMAFTLRRW